MDISGCGASISEKIALKFTHINSSDPSFARSVTKKIILTQFHALQKSETCSVATLRNIGRPSMKNIERKLLLRAGTLLSERG